uniref:Glutamate--cysteine ligase n=1 Tax=Dugesia japonica TaxID=6161 RepID=M9NVE9_DUGJA|nr:gamma-glutamylcysteine synthetase [Dugesia japonica]
MGLLTVGTPLSWEETKNSRKYIKENGIIQFINHYKKVKDRNNDQLFWGDEIEYTLVEFDHKQEKVYVLLKASEVLRNIEINVSNQANTVWHPEYAAYAIEGVPGYPYGHLMGYFNTVESNMQSRRNEINELYLKNDECMLTITAFPRLGCPNFTSPKTKPDPIKSVSKSLFFPDEAIQSDHPRFKTLTRNIRERRGKKVAINIPIFVDENTIQPFEEDLSLYGDDGTSQEATKLDHVYLDAMGFGMGCGCLQTTFQACNIEEARILYDQLTPLCPILMALSASTPIVRGYLLDIDCRWDIIAASVDDRTDEELGIKELKEQQFRIYKSRYDSVDAYLSPDGEEFIDEDVVIDEGFYQTLREHDIDHLLAQHIAHLFIRDPISLFRESIKINNEIETDHFENIQSTNWQSMRFKLPPPNSPIGWRVEFRPMDLQITDFENAAYVTFVVLVTRVILTMKLNFLIPISKVNENMHTAMKRDAVRKEKFFFRKGEFISTGSTPPETAEVCDRKRSCSESNDKMRITPENCHVELSINEIINGGDNFPGLVPLIRQYLQMVDADVDTMCSICQYLNLIETRASGSILTAAGWMRDFVRNHPEYSKDSIVTEKINYDLMKEIDLRSKGKSKPPSLLPNYKSKTVPNLSKATTAGEEYLNSIRNTNFV